MIDLNSASRTGLLNKHQDLNELIRALSTFLALNSPIEKSIKDIEDNAENRARLAQQDGPLFLSPPWNTTFENSFVWIEGCTIAGLLSPSIHLVYSLCGSEIEAWLGVYLNGQREADLGETSADQLNLIGDL